MENQFDGNSLNEQAITDLETARLALRWALDKIRELQEDSLRAQQNLQEKSSQLAFLENQLKHKNSELEKILRSHDEEMKSKQDSLEYQFRTKLERVGGREKELEDKIARQEEVLKQKESKLLDDYQKKSDELRGRWAQIEAELWQLRQEQMLKQQEFEKIYAARLEEERKRAAEEMETARASLEKTYAARAEEFEKRERAVSEELKKQEAVLKWAKDSFQQESVEREKALKKKDLEIDKKLLEKNQEIDDYRVKVGLLEKQLKDLPEAVRKRDEDLERYKTAMTSLENVIRALEDEKKHFQQDSEARLAASNEALEAEKARYREMEAEIPRRLKIAIEHERGRFAEKLGEAEARYKEDLLRRAEEVDHLEKNLRMFEETIKTLQAERKSLADKAEQLQAQLGAKAEEYAFSEKQLRSEYETGLKAERESSANKIEQLQARLAVKAEEAAFREKQLQSEYDVRVRVEIEKHTAALKNEAECAQRIYEDNLRLKVTETAHLRHELESAEAEKLNLSGQAGELRRGISALKEKHAAELEASSGRARNAYETRLSVELDEAAKRHAAEKQKLMLANQEDIHSLELVIAKKNDEGQKLNGEIIRLEEERKLAVIEERRKAKNELEAQAASFRDTVRLYEEKILQMNRGMEGLKTEQEETILLERERLERLYSEKEKDFDEQLARKNQEAAKLREELIRLDNARDNAAAQAAREEELYNGKIRVLSEKVAALTTDAQARLEEAVGKEAARAAELLARKNQELDAARALLESREDAYRRSFDDLRAKLGAAAGGFESAKKLAEERQGRIAALELELAEARSRLNNENTALSDRLSHAEKQYSDMKAEYENRKVNAENQIQESAKRLNDALLKLRNAEEQKAAREKLLDEAARGRNAEILRLESEKNRLEAELGEKLSQFKISMDNERKESRRLCEELAGRSADREKALAGEINSLKAALNAGEMAAENLKQELKILSDRHEAVQAALREKDEAIKDLTGELAGFRRMQEEYEKLKKSLEQLKARIKLWKKD